MPFILMPMTVVSGQPQLVVVRGNSESGKRGLIDQVARYSLAHGFHVVIEGILDARRYGPMLTALKADHAGPAHFYYLDVCLEETIRRHAGRPQAAEFGPDDMRAWYLRLDLLPEITEQVIGQDSALAQTVDRILAESGLLGAVLLRAEQATRTDLPWLLKLVAEVEPLSGPMPDFATRARRAIERGSLVVVRDPREVVLGAALVSGDPRHRRISWLAVRPGARRCGVAGLLMTEITRRWPELGSGAEFVGEQGPDHG